ncbi:MULTISPECIES: pilus assembly protein PilP [Gulbenkiania]|uniref:Tfp pilus assembly protein PilP n=2 Tax=Gulbenkiania TaxID=397456 RepID=A0A0K6GTI4_9NEIS|nr:MULTISPECIES: pilus assembly protein PilP [Gulbenkiania]TCW31701.1 type IV pilus assembly protein PilP [Gulbenkiania mobilis]CUA81826.1 Tfp pilus assembly protein PilP [Gulbenkiania indica]
MKPYLALLLLALAGCSSNDTEDLDQWMKEASQNLRGQVEPVPQVQPYTPFVYNASGLLDPFNPQKLQVARRQNSASAPDLSRPRELLENFELEKLSMVGILRRNGTTYALVRTPDGAIYRVQPGNFMGTNYGLIKRITETEIELAETVEDLNGEWVQRTTSLYLLEQGQKQ